MMTSTVASEDPSDDVPLPAEAGMVIVDGCDGPPAPGLGSVTVTGCGDAPPAPASGPEPDGACEERTGDADPGPIAEDGCGGLAPGPYGVTKGPVVKKPCVPLPVMETVSTPVMTEEASGPAGIV